MSRKRETKNIAVSIGKRRLYLPLLVLLLTGSGCAALIYEVVWFQLLQLVIGSSGVSLGLLYSGKIAGAVFGCFISGFYLLRMYDMAIATYAAVGINLAFGIASYLPAAVNSPSA